MNRAWPMGASLLAAAAALADAGPQTVRYLASRSIDIEYRAAGAAEATSADLWVSTDGGRTWQRAETESVGRTTLRYTAAADGRYDFYLVLHNQAGPSGDDPVPGAAPTITVITDTVPPLFQAHSAKAEVTSDGDRSSVAIRATLVEENLGAGAVRVFYRAEGGEWADGGAATRSGDGLSWIPPESAGRTADLRLVATDLAGNRTTSDLPQVVLPRSPHDAAGNAAATRPAVGPWPENIEPVEPPVVAAVTPPTVEPVGAVPVAPPAPAEPTSRPATAEPQSATADPQLLRQLAGRFMRDGRFALAAARLEEAQAAAPHDPDVLVELGSALYRLRRYDDAGQRFQAGLDLSGEHPGALEGLALVAATQKRYPQAREHLKHLLGQQPEAGSVWLRLGDIEHRLGNEAEALGAWERVLTARETDADARRQAQRRLDYFGSRR